MSGLHRTAQPAPQKPRDAEARLEDAAARAAHGGRDDVELTLRDEDNEYYRPASLTSDGYRYIKKTVEAAFPYAAAVPFILPAGTDARQFTELSDAMIRFAPIDINKQLYASVHRPKRALTGTAGERSL